MKFEFRKFLIESQEYHRCFKNLFKGKGYLLSIRATSKNRDRLGLGGSPLNGLLDLASMASAYYFARNYDPKEFLEKQEVYEVSDLDDERIPEFKKVYIDARKKDLSSFLKYFINSNIEVAEQLKNNLLNTFENNSDLSKCMENNKGLFSRMVQIACDNYDGNDLIEVICNDSGVQKLIQSKNDKVTAHEIQGSVHEAIEKYFSLLIDLIFESGELHK